MSGGLIGQGVGYGIGRQTPDGPVSDVRAHEVAEGEFVGALAKVKSIWTGYKGAMDNREREAAAHRARLLSDAVSELLFAAATLDNAAKNRAARDP